MRIVIDSHANPNYLASTLGQRKARNYPELGLSTTLPTYESFRLHPESVQWVSDPERFTALWLDFQS
jgi:glucose-6-phosphate isomerase, archaeal